MKPSRGNDTLYSFFQVQWRLSWDEISSHVTRCGTLEAVGDDDSWIFW